MALCKITCPHCGAVLRSAKGLAVGKALQCVKCQAPFTVSVSDVVAAPAEPIAVTAVAVHEAGEFALPGPTVNTVGTSDLLLEGVKTDEPPRIGILEDATATSAAPRYGIPYASSLPMPQASADAVLTTVGVAPPRNRSGSALLAVGGLLLFLAGGAVLTYLCFAGDDAEPEPVAHGPAVTSNDKPPPAENAEPAEERKPAPDVPGEPARPPSPKRPKEDGSRPGSRIALPAGSLLTFDKTATKAHPEQKRINVAVDRAVKYVRSQQAASGSWLPNPGKHAVGYAALPGLTLLECGVAADDPAVQKAAKFVRDPKNVANLQETYDLALAILFLDRLGDSRDRTLIQTLALRLVAGQNAAGGWDYKCRVLSPSDSDQLLKYLQDTRPQALLLTPVNKGAAPAAPKNPLPADQPKVKPKSAGGLTAQPEFLPQFIQGLPIAKSKGKGKNLRASGRDDNSNSQFALLALWAARRHDVPTERTLVLAEERYHVSQNPNGGWGYMLGQQSTPSMTCVGLLGLAMGHGASADAFLAAARKHRDTAMKEDPVIQEALRHLGGHIGTPPPAGFVPPMANLYFLWSVERVAMLYNLPTIGNKDWYSWGVSVLLPNQKDNGSWRSAAYPGQGQANLTIDTCFALLFLKRSNLVQDLTENLQLYMAISDPDARK